MNQEPINYFLHIPKTAGTSLHTWLNDCNQFNICPDYLWGYLLDRKFEELQN
jgi:hypothetical protein